MANILSDSVELPKKRYVQCTLTTKQLIYRVLEIGRRLGHYGDHPRPQVADRGTPSRVVKSAKEKENSDHNM